MTARNSINLQLFQITFYALFFNLISESHNWFQNEFKNILQISFGITTESEVTRIIVVKNSLQAIGMIFSGFLWPWLNKKMTNKNCMAFSAFLQIICMFLFGVASNAYTIPLIFLIKGITFGVYSVGITVIYDFCPPEKLKTIFTLIIVISIAISKVVGQAGRFLYEYFGNSFFVVNSLVGVTMALFLVVFMLIFESKAKLVTNI